MSTLLLEVEKQLRKLEQDLREMLIVAADLPADVPGPSSGMPKATTCQAIQQCKAVVKQAIDHIENHVICSNSEKAP